MLDSKSVSGCHAVFGESEFTYQSVLDDFKNAKFIGIITYNISTKTDGELLEALKAACLNGANAVIITAIPKRFPSYYKTVYAEQAKRMIDRYIQLLNPLLYGTRLNTFFSFHNHAKIIMTDNIVYWGSSNFSDESATNFECGTISTDQEFITYLRTSLFPDVQQKSVPYYKYNFALAIANLESLIPACTEAKKSLHEAAYAPWSDFETHFEEVWVYRKTDSGLTVQFLRDFIEFYSQFDRALDVIDDIIDKYANLEELPDQVKVLQDILEQYRQTYADFDDMISSLFEELEEVAQYDVSEEANRKINAEYSMEAYDEHLDRYAEMAMSEANDEYETLIEGSEQTICDALDGLDAMINYFEQLKTNLSQLLKVDSRIDNTGICE